MSLRAPGAGSGLPSVTGLSLGGQLGSLSFLLQLFLNSLEEIFESSLQHTSYQGGSYLQLSQDLLLAVDLLLLTGTLSSLQHGLGGRES